MKAIIPVAGLGTRMLPATKAIPKEMFPLVDKPLIQYIVNECAAAGVTEIVLVTHSSKNAIEDHFDTSFELEATLEKRVKRSLLEEVQSITPKGVRIMAVRQGIAKGLGHAILCARPIIGESPFVVILPDVIMDEYTANPNSANLAAMIKRYKTTGASQIMVGEVPEEDVSSYGIADCNGAVLKAGECAKIESLVEKPSIKDAPSNLAVIGRYVLSPSVWTELAKTLPGAGGEIQLTDAIDHIIKHEVVEAYCMEGVTHDCGSKEGYVKAFATYALRNPAYKQAILDALDNQ